MSRFIAFVDMNYYPYLYQDPEGGEYREPTVIEADSAEAAAEIVAASAWDEGVWDAYVVPLESVVRLSNSPADGRNLRAVGE